VIPKALTIAGSDSSGGAGIQADLKTFSALHVYGMSVVTSVTAQNTARVLGVSDLPPQFVALQLEAVLTDLRPGAVKTGMLSSVGIVEAVAEKMQEHSVENLVVDPVMVSKSGVVLLQPEARGALRSLLLPRALIATPNTEEAEVLTGETVSNIDQMKRAATVLHKLGPRWVLVKGGHLPGEDVVDVLYDGQDFRIFSEKRIETRDSHGTGCILSAAVAAKLAQGLNVPDAVREARIFLTAALKRSLRIGSGSGPCDPVGIGGDDSARAW